MHDLLFCYALVHGPAAFEGLAPDASTEDDE